MSQVSRYSSFFFWLVGWEDFLLSLLLSVESTNRSYLALLISSLNFFFKFIIIFI